MESCLNGNYIQEFPNEFNGLKRSRLRRITNAELAKTAAEKKVLLCSCSICTKRRKNQYDVTIGTRSGLLRGWEKYGTGRVLGSGEEVGGGRQMLVVGG